MTAWSKERIQEAIDILQKWADKSEIKQSEVNKENAIRILDELNALAEIAYDSYVQDRSRQSLILKKGIV
jgi:lipopolysaccharide assembly outer membrane protein LptD (OstA)